MPLTVSPALSNAFFDISDAWAYPTTSPDEANNCYNYLEKHNIFVRKVSEYGLADCLRITIGLEEENIFLIKIINDFMKNN